MSKNGKFFKKLWHLLKEPNLILLCLNWFVTLVSAIGSIIVCIMEYMGIFAYIVYVIAAISLSYSIYTTVKFAPTVKERVMESLKRQKIIKNYLEDFSFKTVVAATLSLLINLGFVAFNTVFAFLSRSVWYGASAAYYFLLCLLKGGLFFGDKKLKTQTRDEREILSGQLKNYRICGIALLVVELAMTGVITLMVLQQRPTVYPEIVAITFATYTFYKITFSIINVVKASARNNPQIQCFRNIGLAETALSLVSLQMALVSTFSDGTSDMRLLNAIVGFTACAFIIGIGVFMIIRASIKIKKLNKKGD